MNPAKFLKKKPEVATIRAKEVAKVNAAGKSFDLATCPFFLASRSFLGVAFSVFSAI